MTILYFDCKLEITLIFADPLPILPFMLPPSTVILYVPGISAVEKEILALPLASVVILGAQ